MKKCLIMVMLLTLIIACTGCTQADSIYRTFSDSYELSDEELKALTEGQLSLNLEDSSSHNRDINSLDVTPKISNFGARAKNQAYALVSKVCAWFRAYGIYIAAISAFTGIIIMRLARKSINIRRKALFILIIGIPLFTVLIMYGSAFLCDALR